MKEPAPLPAVGLYSEAALASGAATTRLTDLRTRIEIGRKPLSAWDSGVKTWLASAGNQIAKEHSEAYAVAVM